MLLWFGHIFAEKVIFNYREIFSCLDSNRILHQQKVYTRSKAKMTDINKTADKNNAGIASRVFEFTCCGSAVRSGVFVTGSAIYLLNKLYLIEKFLSNAH